MKLQGIFSVVLLSFISVAAFSDTKETAESFKKSLTPGQKRDWEKDQKQVNRGSSTFEFKCKTDRLPVTIDVDPKIALYPKWHKENMNAAGAYCGGIMDGFAILCEDQGKDLEAKKRIVTAIGKLKRIDCSFDYNNPEGKEIGVSMKDGKLFVTVPANVRMDSYVAGRATYVFLKEHFDF